MSDYSSPGVYVVEDHSLSLDINHSETAVPAFLCVGAEFATLIDKEGGDAQPVASISVYAWLDIARKVEAEKKAEADVGSGGGAGAEKKASAGKKAEEKSETKSETKSEAKVKGDAKSDAKASLADTQIYRALQAYFENGGGPCYVLNGVDEAAANHTKLLADVTLLVQAGVASSESVTTFCQNNRAVFGIIDGTVEANGSAPPGKQSTAGFSNTAAYHPPFIRAAPSTSTSAKKDGDAEQKPPQLIPASAVMAGIYCRVDRERGVWKAPANVEVRGGLIVSEHVSREHQEKLYEQTPSINIIRGLSGKSPIVWGARTSASAADGRDFRYVPVRRLFNAVERDIKATLSIAVFEPNSPATWERVRGAIDNYLHDMWKKGALMGDRPDQAYLVQVGLGVTMTDDDLQSGRMIVKVAIAPSRPAEFIILQFSQNLGLG